MGSQIRITPEQMNQKANAFRNEEQNFSGVVANMRNMVNQLPEEWEGQASQAFCQQFEGLEKSFRQTSDLILSIAQQMDQIADAVLSLDNDMSTKIKGL
ncbi:MAG: WXG100 family type VII secretion target [Erysipelotrichaceae bacterium]